MRHQIQEIMWRGSLIYCSSHITSLPPASTHISSHAVSQSSFPQQRKEAASSPLLFKSLEATDSQASEVWAGETPPLSLSCD